MKKLLRLASGRFLCGPHKQNILSSLLPRRSKRQRLQELLLALKSRLARPSLSTTPYRRLVSEIQIKQYFTVYSSTLVDENNLLRFGDVPTLLGDTTLTLHGDDDLLSSVRFDQVEVRFADPLSLAQLPPG